MIEASILDSVGAAAISAALGALTGLVWMSAIARQRAARRRAMRAEEELSHAMRSLTDQDEPEPLNEVLTRQEEAIRTLARTEERRQQLNRLLLGYGALLSLTLVVLGVTAKSVPVWPFVGSAAAFMVLAVVIFRAAEKGRLSIKIGPLETSLYGHTLYSQTHGWGIQDLEERVVEALEQQGWIVSRAPSSSGADLVATVGEDRYLVEVKAKPEVSVRDLDALIGAAARMSRSEGSRINAMLVAPDEASSRPSLRRYLREAGPALVAVQTFDAAGNLRPVDVKGP